VSFLRRPPPPFDINFAGCERQSDDTDEEWLPDVEDVIFGDYHVLIDLTGDSDSEGDTVFSARDLRSSLGATNLATPPSRLERSPLGNRPLGVNQPSQAVDCLASDKMEIPESPSTVRVSPAASVERCHSNRGSSKGPQRPLPSPRSSLRIQRSRTSRRGRNKDRRSPTAAGAICLLADRLTLGFLRLPSRSWSLARSLKVKARRPCRSVVHEHRL